MQLLRNKNITWLILPRLRMAPYLPALRQTLHRLPRTAGSWKHLLARFNGSKSPVPAA